MVYFSKNKKIKKCAFFDVAHFAQSFCLISLQDADDSQSFWSL
jgi:hypothetical protein